MHFLSPWLSQPGRGAKTAAGHGTMAAAGRGPLTTADVARGLEAHRLRRSVPGVLEPLQTLLLQAVYIDVKVAVCTWTTVQ